MKLLSRGTNGNSVYTAWRGRAQPQATFRTATWFQEVSLSLMLYVLSLTASAVIMVLIARQEGYGVGNAWAVLLLALTAVISERQRVWLSDETQASISIVPI